MPFTITTSHHRTIAFRALLSPGLHRFTVDADAANFDWESLYVTLDIYNNVNQRTGPWDFNLLENNRPVLPAYWVFLDERKIGLWYFNRPSDSQIKAKRFKGEASFWIEEEREYSFRFEPYQDFQIEWQNVFLEDEPDDRLLDETELQFQNVRPAESLFDEARWSTLAQNFADQNFLFSNLLQKSFEWAKSVSERGTTPLPLLAMHYRLTRDADSLQRAKEIIEKQLSFLAWGNAREDGYGHNGDMGAAEPILNLALALHWLCDDLDESLKARMLVRIEKHGDTFLEMALLHRGYWGGSILQDHGFISFSFFTTAAYCLLGQSEKALQWLRFCLPRMERTYNALPTDGVFPASSYHLIYLYTDKLVPLRELHRIATSEDIYARPAFANLSAYALDSYDEKAAAFLHPSPRADFRRFCGGHPFLMQMATTFGDAKAHHLMREYVRVASTENFISGSQENATFIGTMWAFLFFAPCDLEFNAPAPRRLNWFHDSGVVIFRDDARGVLFAAQCGAPLSQTSYNNTTCACDRIIFAPLSGNFTLAKNGRLLIQTAEGGYKMQSLLGNILLVDGRGQSGDHGAPMSHVGVEYNGEQIEEARFDEKTGAGYIKMNLAPAYDGDLQIESYTREWFFEPSGVLQMRDCVVSSFAHRFQWLFHSYRRHSISQIAANCFSILSGEEEVALRVQSSTPLQHHVADTPTVWAYVNENDDEPCRHLAFETRESVTKVTADFVFDFHEDAPRIDSHLTGSC